jgi:transposase
LSRSAGTGTGRGETTIQASDDGVLHALRFAVGLDDDRVWAVEDCRHVTSRLERALLGAGERVVRVPPVLTGESRKASRTPGKSDPIDARAIGLAAIREGVESLPVAFLDQQAHEIRVLCDYRDQLMHERVRLINGLRWHLVRIAPRLEAQLGPEALKGPRIRHGSPASLDSCRPAQSCASRKPNCVGSTRSPKNRRNCSPSSPT